MLDGEPRPRWMHDERDVSSLAAPPSPRALRTEDAHAIRHGFPLAPKLRRAHPGETHGPPRRRRVLRQAIADGACLFDCEGRRPVLALGERRNVGDCEEHRVAFAQDVAHERAGAVLGEVERPRRVGFVAANAVLLDEHGQVRESRRALDARAELPEDLAQAVTM